MHLYTNSMTSISNSQPSISQFSRFLSPKFYRNTPSFRHFRFLPSNFISLCKILNVVIPLTMHLLPESVHQSRHSVTYLTHRHKRFFSRARISYADLIFFQIAPETG